MAIKPPELLNRLPSVSELLEKPPIRALADRWNRSVVAGRVQSFLDELRNDLRRRAADIPIPSVRELAERAARYVMSQQQLSLGMAINATGQLWGGEWCSLPLADAALERAVAVGRDFILPAANSNSGPAPLNPAPQLCRLTGAEAAVAVHSYAGAIWLTLSAIAAGREVLVARSEVGEVDRAAPLDRLAAAAGVQLHEIGTTARATAADYESAINERTAAVLKFTSETYRVVGKTAVAELNELAALAGKRELTLIDALGTAPLTDSSESVPWSSRNVRTSITAGAGLVVVRGDGLVGGPACGILLGRRDLLQRISEHPLFAAWQLDALRSAGLLATLEAYEAPPPGVQSLPVWQLLTAPIENLRNRAERMAPQLAQASGIASAVAIEMRSPISAALGCDGGWPSYGVALTAADGDVRALDQRFRTAAPPVFGRIDGDRLLLDLRTVIARQDMQLIESLLGTGAEPSNTQAAAAV